MHILIGQMLCNALEYKLGYSHLIKEEQYKWQQIEHLQ